jgi:uncharacterized protein YjbI with pentapeptide repeats
VKKTKGSRNDGCQRDAADLPGHLEQVEGAAALFAQADVEVMDQLVSGLQLEDAEIRRLRLEGCVLERVSMPRGVIRTGKWKDVRFTECDLANVEISALSAVRVEMTGCRLTGLRLGETSWQSLMISGGDQRYVQFRFSTFQNCEFIGCDFQEADFHGADLRGCVFKDCRLNNVEMTRAKLSGTDLRGSTVDGMKLEAADLRGAIVDVAQALEFAPLLGIEIR